MANINPNTHTSDLANFLKSDLYEKWKTDRKQHVEDKWQRNEDAFKGDSAGKFWKCEETDDWRSNTFVMATKNKVLNAYAIVIDMLLQGGKLPFSLELSPWDMIVMEDLNDIEKEKAQDDIDDMTGLIQQQVLDCKGDRELMNCVMSAAKLGETYWNSYVHTVTRKGYRRLNMAPEGTEDPEGRFTRYEQYEEEINAPAFEYDSCWDMFRDMETDDMQKSRGYCKRSFVSPFDLRSLKGEPHYIDEAIDKVIANNMKHGATTDTDSQKPGLRKIQDRYNNIEMLVFWCRVPRETLELFEKELKGKGDSLKSVDPENDGDEVEIGAWLAADEVIRLIRIPQGTRPHGRVVWEINLDDNHGTGVGDNVENMQLTLNGLWRAFEDNKKLSANVIVAIRKALLSDWSGQFKPGEIIEIVEEAKSAAEAIYQVIIQDVGESLLSAIGLAERYIDEDTQLPKILQGAVHEKRKADTLGELNILMSNAGKYLGSVIMNFDEGMIEQIVSRFLEYNMNDPAVTKGKGNYIAKPLGFAGYQNKIVLLTKYLQALNIVLNSPAVMQETKLKPFLENVFKGLDIDPQLVFKTRAEKEVDAKTLADTQRAQADQAGIAMLAEIKAETEKEVVKIVTQSQEKMKQMLEAHKQTLVENEEESENRIVEDRVTGVG